MFYRIKRYGPAANDRYGIDTVGPAGQYMAQAAFWFDGRAAAAARLAEIIIEDAANGETSREWRPSATSRVAQE
jgi:hypothetical protein